MSSEQNQKKIMKIPLDFLDFLIDQKLEENSTQFIFPLVFLTNAKYQVSH